MARSDDKPLTAHGLANLLQVDVRRLERALRSRPCDETDQRGRRRWKVGSALQALAEHGVNVRRGGPGAPIVDPEFGRLAIKVEELGNELDADFKQLRGLPDVIERRRLSPSVAAKIQNWADALIAVTPPDELPFLKPHLEDLACKAWQKLLYDVCEWELETG
jgi:hypothetical protein